MARRKGTIVEAGAYPLRLVYVNTVHLNKNKGEGTNLPCITVDDPNDVMKGQKDVYQVQIGEHTRVVYYPDGHWRGPHIVIETTEKVACVE